MSKNLGRGRPPPQDARLPPADFGRSLAARQPKATAIQVAWDLRQGTRADQDSSFAYPWPLIFQSQFQGILFSLWYSCKVLQLASVTLNRAEKQELARQTAAILRHPENFEERDLAVFRLNQRNSIYFRTDGDGTCSIIGTYNL